MKKYLLPILMVSSFISSGQCPYYTYHNLHFDYLLPFCQLSIDTFGNEDNIWQIGNPQKSVFTSSTSLSKVIVTDTLNSYPINDTSSFTITNVMNSWGDINDIAYYLTFSYYVNSDTLNDYGKIEFSPDNGILWINLLTDTAFSASIHLGATKPVLSGNSSGWKSAGIVLTDLEDVFNINNSDTFKFRFSFISDSVQTFKDGLMFDNFYFSDAAEGVHDINADYLLSMFPVPASEKIYLKRQYLINNDQLRIFTISGRMILEIDDFEDNHVNISALDPGIYFLQLSNAEHNIRKRFTVMR